MFRIRLTPKSSSDRIEGTAQFDAETVLKARVRAVPDKGVANAALLKLVGKWLGVPASSVSLASSSKSRLKSVHVAGDCAELEAAAKSRLSG